MWADHLLAAVLLIGTPAVGWMTARSGRLARAQDIDRTMTYAANGALLAVVAAAVLALWLWDDRPLAELRFGGPSFGGAGALVALLSLLGAEAVAAALWVHARRPDLQRRYAKLAHSLHHGGLVGLLPRTPSELAGFSALTAVAALAEELIFRAFAVWWLDLWMPLWAAVALAAVPFAMGHAYQGWRGPAKAFGAALALGALMVATGSIWPGVLLHAAMNIATASFVMPHLRHAGLGLHGPHPAQ
jgi:membrane protease YdiL (CAAX protease family)